MRTNRSFAVCILFISVVCVAIIGIYLSNTIYKTSDHSHSGDKQAQDEILPVPFLPGSQDSKSNMSAAIFVPDSDITNFTDTSTVINDIRNEFDFYRNFAVNTVFVRMPTNINIFSGLKRSDGSDFDLMECILSNAKLWDNYIILSVSKDTLNADSFDLEWILNKYSFNAVFLSYDGYNNDAAFLKDVKQLNKFISEHFDDILFGCEMNSDVDENLDFYSSKILTKNLVDFVVLNIHSGSVYTTNTFTNNISLCNDFSKEYPDIPFFCMHRFDLIDPTASPAKDIKALIDVVYDNENICGNIYYPMSALKENKSAAIYISEKYYGDPNEDFAIKDMNISPENDKVTFSGSTIADKKLTCNRKAIEHDGNDFSCTFTLSAGKNTFTFRNYCYTKSFDIENISEPSSDDKITPFSDNGYGRSLMCRVDRNSAPALSAVDDYDSFHPDVFDIPAGTVDYVKNITFYERLRYELESGIIVSAEDCTLLNNAYTMPINNAEFVSCDDSDERYTEIVIGSKWNVPVVPSLSPQDYHKGHRNFSFAIDEFTAEYFDICFYYTENIENIEKLIFDETSIVSHYQLLNNENGSVTLRLFLKETGKFFGYSSKFKDGNFVIYLNKRNINTQINKTVILDPGHGGVYMTGTALQDQSIAEKQANLEIAKKVEELLKKQGINVIMSRDREVSFSLFERREMCLALSPDIYVSIHCDGSDDKAESGTHTFYYKSYSQPLANSIHKKLVYNYSNYLYSPGDVNYKNIDKGIKYYPFYVTRVDNCPSVLVETGFMTNLTEGQLLTDDKCTDFIAAAIAEGITDYFNTR